MKRVIFPCEETAAGLIKYPDDISMFSNTVQVGTNIVADYVGNKALAAYIPPDAPVSTKITRLAYLNRLGPELEAIYELAKTNVKVQIYKDKVLAADCIDLADPDVAIGLNVMKASGIYIATRVTEILTNPITLREAFTG